MKKLLLAVTMASLVSSMGTINTANAQYTHHNGYHHSMSTQYQNDCCDGWVNNQIVDSMHMPMMNTDFVQSGNVDKDFIANMIPHHQGAIDSAKMILEYSSNKDVRNIAQNIINAQEKEIAEFTALLDDNKLTNTQISDEDYAKFVADEKNAMNEMMNKMMAVTKTRDLKTADYTFILAMKYHHEGAVNASKQILAYTNDPTIKKIAQQIISDQDKEIQEFDKLIEQGL